MEFRIIAFRRKKLSENSTYLFLERWVEREKERERNINAWLPLAYPLLGGMWPD